MRHTRNAAIDVAGTTAVTVRVARRRRTRPAVNAEALYQRANDLIKRHRIDRMVTCEEGEAGAFSLRICNLWRVDRAADGSIQTLRFCLLQERWLSTNDCAGWPEVPFAPVPMTRGLWWASLVMKLAVCLAADAVSDGRVAKGTLRKVKQRLVEEHRCHMSYVAFSAGKALVSAVYRGLVDKEVVSALLAMRVGVITVASYIDAARFRVGLLRIAREHRNLLPLCVYIAPEEWERRDLFSRAMWDARGSRKAPIERMSLDGRLRGLPSDAVYRLLLRLPLTVVRAYANGRDAWDVDPLAILIGANITVHLPAIAWVQMLTATRCSQIAQGQDGTERLQRLYRVFAEDCAKRWTHEGFRELVTSLKRNELSDVVDWLVAEGGDQGHPKSGTTWAALCRRSRRWHGQIARNQQIARDQAMALADRSWKALVDAGECDGIRYWPVVSTRDLAALAQEQQHCVLSYEIECASGNYAVYAVQEPDGVISTLGLEISTARCWVQQHRGVRNAAVSASAAKAGMRICLLYQQALRAARESS